MEPDKTPRRRHSLSALERRQSYERTDQLARQTLEDERRKRDEKTKRLREARLQAQNQETPH